MCRVDNDLEHIQAFFSGDCPGNVYVEMESGSGTVISRRFTPEAALALAKLLLDAADDAVETAPEITD